MATAIEDDIGEPVFLTGTSTGGSKPLLSVDRPDLVGGLVVVVSAYRLGHKAARCSKELARSIRAGDFARGWAQVITTGLVPTALQGPRGPCFGS